MSLATWTDLQTAIAEWLIRAGEPEITARVADFICLCEEDLRNDLKVRELRMRCTATLNEEWEWLPDNYKEMESVKVITPEGRKYPVSYIGSGQVALRQFDLEQFSYILPRHYNIVNDQIQFIPSPSEPAEPEVEENWPTFELVYWAEITALGEGNGSNVVLQKYPQAYLYGSLLHSAPYVKEQEWITIWQNGYDRSVSKANKLADRGQKPGPAVISMPR